MNLNILKTLESTGLTKKQSETYLDLLIHGNSQTGKICKRTNIPSSHIYQILETLVEKGLISFKLINNIKIFKANDPTSLKNLFDEKEKKIKQEKKELLKSISELKIIPPDFEKNSDFEYYKGVSGIKSLFNKIMNSWKKEDEYYIASAPNQAFKKMEGFFINEVFKRKNKDKIKLKILINRDSKEFGEKRKKEPLTKVKYLKINTSTEYGVLNDYFFLINYNKEPYALLIKDKNFAQTYKAFFEILWDNATEN